MATRYFAYRLTIFFASTANPWAGTDILTACITGPLPMPVNSYYTNCVLALSYSTRYYEYRGKSCITSAQPIIDKT